MPNNHHQTSGDLIQEDRNKHHNAPTKWHVAYQSDFEGILGPNPILDLVLEIDAYPFAHEAGVYLDATNELIVTSNQYPDSSGKRNVQISKIKLGDGSKPAVHEEIHCDLVHMANGGINYQDGVLLCAQGSGTRPSGLFKMSTSAPYKTEPIVTDFLTRPFNSVNDVVVHSNGSIWFTDPSYGHDQGYRPRPNLPNQVYRFDPATGDIRAVADGFGRPNGICFSPDEKEVYITDTDQIHGPSTDCSRPASM